MRWFACKDSLEAWDDGICGPLVAHLLFGTQDHVVAKCSTRPIWRKQLIFRCGNVRGVKGQHAGDFCHDVVNEHDEHRLDALVPKAPVQIVRGRCLWVHEHG